MKRILSVLFVAAIALTTGCSHVSKIGSISAIRPDGSTNRIDFLKVQATSLLGPSQTGVYAVSQGEITAVTTTAAGNGLGPALVGAAGIVGGAAALGATLEPDKTYVTSSGSASAGGGSSSATGGSATASPTVNVAPYKGSKPPDNRPPHKKH